VEGRVARILAEVESEGEAAVRRWAEKLGDLEPGAPLIVPPEALTDALRDLPTSQWEVLERVAERIRRFARQQSSALGDFEVSIPGGLTGQRMVPVQTAGCYAPGGRYPLPSSVLMTAVTARVAGVEQVWLASPRPSLETLAAAAIADVDGVLAVGGAQAVAALAYGAGGVPACDVVVGPGNVWVTTAKRLLVGTVGIDLLAGPSELVIVADDAADPALLAADLLAQAEHDGEALPILITPSAALVETVERELAIQLRDLKTAETAEISLQRGFAVLTGDLDEAVEVANRLAPEHLQIMTRRPSEVGSRSRSFGGLFLGASTPEVLGDYGAGPNHTLPTGGTARFASGLSVLDFLCQRTWIEIDSAEEARELYEDAAVLAEMEGLAAHRRAAELRILEKTTD
jgi:phosphoribosyl-ATP pyrophosphohydrolase/phosphoribosyl-AMP cyclohydrolase/histidinol dehydrogenase